MYTEIKKCRICEKTELITVLSLGNQYLTGVFPKSITEKVTRGPLDMVWCTNCGLLQMKQSYSSEEMYGDNYGYRSGLNSSMVKHLQQKIGMLESLVKLAPTDLMVDIGSNDATLLKACSGKYKKVEIDPTGNKFKKYYTKDMVLISDFFSASVFKKYFLNKKAKLITAIAMFYDLEDPKAFVRDIEKCLSADGIWHFEQSYMPSMLRTNAYDTICHEHLEFYSFRVVKNLLENCGMRVIDVQMNSINGGSFAVTACKKNANYSSNKPIINWLLKQEKDMGLETPKPYRDFEEKVYRHRENLKELIKTLVKDGKKIVGYGASTKGNVLLQFCSLGTKQIPFIAEVNKDKFGSYTPGTKIPIISEEEAKNKKPDYFFVLPWHFKHNILERERNYLAQGGKFIFPLPEIEIL
ncbi:MAG: methyltransferase [Candidatus Pacebacteria bacterium RIFOXYA1_FULL_38_18]|nr:MAG: methyltransferase [Candidatus Pacebacteria bacterium RIFOXYA1_FULL_38_18]OGJ39467.1 MAG: methyltransferase [Candidatus Pacebacteria bacterium RIFOXYC1_FULL_39_21]